MNLTSAGKTELSLILSVTPAAIVATVATDADVTYAKQSYEFTAGVSNTTAPASAPAGAASNVPEANAPGGTADSAAMGNAASAAASSTAVTAGACRSAIARVIAELGDKMVDSIARLEAPQELLCAMSAAGFISATHKTDVATAPGATSVAVEAPASGDTSAAHETTAELTKRAGLAAKTPAVVATKGA
ncbi:hypothetical protein KJY77_03590 [Canibacter sp. lx-72]|nr:hypothetical protein [Canibacter zhuwentaonis]MBT1018221.1 hypothetical protein [Canibacter zhuwentaonis]MBT1035231.1 hypothetical protein [Canibacter zhuwentaonis]